MNSETTDKGALPPVIRLNNSIEEIRTYLLGLVAQLQKEVVGYCVGTGKAEQLSEIGRHTDVNFDFEKFSNSLSSDYVYKVKAEQESKELLSSLTDIKEEDLRSQELQLKKTSQRLEEYKMLLKEIKQHNKSHLKYPLTISGIREIEKAGIWGKLSDDHKNAKKIMLRIKERFGCNFESFLIAIKETRGTQNRLDSAISMKKALKFEYQQAKEKYEALKRESSEFDIHKSFADFVLKAFCNEQYLELFANLSKSSGRSIVQAALKYRLMRMIYGELERKVSSFDGTMFDLKNEHNASIVLKELNSILEKLEKIKNATHRFKFNNVIAFKDINKMYLREISILTGYSFHHLANERFGLEGNILDQQLMLVSEVVSAEHKSTLEVKKEVKEEKGGFMSMLIPGRKKRTVGKELLRG